MVQTASMLSVPSYGKGAPLLPHRNQIQEQEQSVEQAGKPVKPSWGVSLVLKTVTTSWVAVLAGAVVAFFLTPVILHRLGDEAYGLWVLITTVVGYYGIFDIGVSSAIVRYVSQQSALGNREGVKMVVATAFYFFVSVCLLVIVSAFLLRPWLSHVLSVREDLVGSFRSLFLLAGIVQGLSFPLLVFSGALQAAARYDQVYLMRIACLVVRVVAVVGALRAGGGLFAVGAAVILSNLLLYVLQVPAACRAVPEISLNPKWVRKSVLCDMFRYGSVSLTVGIGQQLKTYIYPFLIAVFLSPAAVTLFSLPTKILAIPTEGIGTMTEFVNPIASQLETHKDFSTLRKLIQLSVQAAFLILAPLAVLLIVLGKELLSLWVGSQYTSAYPLLVLLTLGMGAAATQCCVQSMLFGVGRHKGLIWYRLGEGLSIAILGTILLPVWGLPGLAVAMAAPLLLSSLILIPRHLCGILNMPLRTYLQEGCMKPCLLALPFAATLLASRSVVTVDKWLTVILVLLAAGFIYLLTLLVSIRCRSVPVVNWFSLGVLEVLDERLRRVGVSKPQATLQKASPGIV